MNWFLLVVLAFAYTTAAQVCYFPGGNAAPNDTACTSDTSDGNGPVPCCGPGRTCLPNRLCSGSDVDPSLSRGSCTDQSWEDPNCPNYCTTFHPGAAVANCTESKGYTIDGSSTYCCLGLSSDCCSNADWRWTAAEWNSTSTLNSEPTSTTSMSSATATDSTSTTSNPPSATTSTTISAPSATTSSSGATHTSSSDRVKLGVGVGIGIGVSLALAIAGALFWQRRRRSTHDTDQGSQWPELDLSTDVKTQQDPRLVRQYSAPGEPIELDTMHSPAEFVGSHKWVNKAKDDSPAEEGENDVKDAFTIIK